MNKEDKFFYNDLKQRINLIAVNWKALKSNPPCENNITQLINETKDILKNWAVHIQKDDKHYSYSKEYNYIKRCRQKQKLKSG